MSWTPQVRAESNFIVFLATYENAMHEALSWPYNSSCHSDNKIPPVTLSQQSSVGLFIKMCSPVSQSQKSILSVSIKHLPYPSLSQFEVCNPTIWRGDVVPFFLLPLPCVSLSPPPI